MIVRSKIKFNFLLVALLSCMTAISQVALEQDKQERNVKFLEDEECGPLKIGSLYAKKIKAKCAQVRNLDAQCAEINRLKVSDLHAVDKVYMSQLCTQSICANSIITYSLDSQNARINDLSAQSAHISNLSVLGACASRLTVNDLCVPGTLRAADLLNCGKYRATVVYSTNTTYTLGQLLSFDTITDDPNGNVTLVPNTRYTAPISGYYILTFEVYQNNLRTDSPVLGSPVVYPQILVNGSEFRSAFSPYLTFFNVQASTLTLLGSLNAGDVIELAYDLITVDQTSGSMNIVGTVDLLGNGTENGFSTVFKIALLNVDCLDLPCAPCIPGTISAPRECAVCPSADFQPCEVCNPCVCPVA